MFINRFAYRPYRPSSAPPALSLVSRALDRRELLKKLRDSGAAAEELRLIGDLDRLVR